MQVSGRDGPRSSVPSFRAQGPDCSTVARADARDRTQTTLYIGTRLNRPAPPIPTLDKPHLPPTFGGLTNGKANPPRHARHASELAIQIAGRDQSPLNRPATAIPPLSQRHAYACAVDGRSHRAAMGPGTARDRDQLPARDARPRNCLNGPTGGVSPGRAHAEQPARHRQRAHEIKNQCRADTIARPAPTRRPHCHAKRDSPSPPAKIPVTGA